MHIGVGIGLVRKLKWILRAKGHAWRANGNAYSSHRPLARSTFLVFCIQTPPIRHLQSRQCLHGIHNAMALQKLTAELYQLYEQSDFEKCQKVLTPIKLELVKHNLLLPTAANSDTSDKINDLKIAERILEIGALSSLLGNNYQGFENYVAQLRPFYSNTRIHVKPEKNTDQTKIISLYLLYLLSQGLISKFHVELELIYNSKQYNVEQDDYLLFPINLEKHLMEGNYIKIWKVLKSDTNLPCMEYSHFLDTLVNALRFEIAKSLEQTYETIPISNCKGLLYYPQEQSDATFESIIKGDLKMSGWVFHDGVITFKNRDESETDVSNPTSASLITNVLSYAERIESIV